MTEPACAGLRPFTFSIELALSLFLLGCEGSTLKENHSDISQRSNMKHIYDRIWRLLITWWEMMNEAKAELPNSAFPVVAT